MRFENLLGRSARILWRHPWLWLLAFLAGETGSGGGSGGNSAGIQKISPRASISDLNAASQWLSDRTAIFLEIALLAAVVGIAWFVVSCLASGALIRAADEFDRGGSISFRIAWGLGRSSFWRVLSFRLLQLLLVLLPALLLVVPPVLGLALGGSAVFKGLLLDLPLFFAYLFWVVFVGWLSVLGLRACVLDGTGSVASFATGFRILRDRFPRVAMTAVMFGLVGFGIGIVTQVVTGLLGAPFLVALGTELEQGRWSQLPGTLLTLLAVLLPVSLVLNSAAGAFFATAWTIAYRRFPHEGEVPEPPPLAA